MTTITTRTRAARRRTRAVRPAQPLAARSDRPMTYYPTRTQTSVEALHLLRNR